jgi:hypothetical protein
MAMYRSTKVLKLMCFFFGAGHFSPPLTTPPALEFESCDIEERIAEGAVDVEDTDEGK